MGSSGFSSRLDTDICIPAHVVYMEDIRMHVHVLAQHIANSLVIFCQPFGQPHGSFIATGSKLGITLQMGWNSSQFGGGRRYGTPIDDTIQRIQAEFDRASSILEIRVIEIDGRLYYVSNRCL